MSSHSQSRRRKHVRHAALFIDYTNLTDILSEIADQTSPADEQVVQLLADLVKTLRRKYRVQVATLRAHGDFGGTDDEALVLQALYAAGIETRFVPAYTAADAALSLGIDVLGLLGDAPDVTTYVLVTGDQAYLPLVRHLRARGRQVIVAAVAPPDLPESQLQRNEAQLVDLRPLVTEQSRRLSVTRPDAARTRRAVDFRRIEDPSCLNTLEVVEEHFGHYDEVYLTPLLRKLSEVFDDPDYDPKTIISELETAGAVRLEKRHGTPYDYTVLIVERTHPDVQIIQRLYEDRDAADPGEADYPAGDESADDVADDDLAGDIAPADEVVRSAAATLSDDDLGTTGDGQPAGSDDEPTTDDDAPEEDRV